MSNITGVGSSGLHQNSQTSIQDGTAPVEGAPTPSQTSSDSSTSAEVNSTPANRTSDEEPSARVTEQRLTGFVREMQVRGTQSTPVQNSNSTQLSEIVHSARRSGMSPAEATSLQNQLGQLSPQTLRSELSFLRRHVMDTPNACRALRTYVGLRNLQATDSNHRLTSDLVHTLTRGVAERRTPAGVGAEGILGQQQALHAAQAMIHMPQGEYQRITRALNAAGQQNGHRVSGADPQAERALILKSVGARQSEFQNSDPMNQIILWSGTTRDIEQYARQIRGTPREDLIRQSTVLDLDGNSQPGALQQRFVDSCTPTVAQMTRAEADPIYARRLHQEAMDSTVRNTRRSETAREQRQQLNFQAPFYIPGHGVIGPGYGNILNDVAARATNNNYVRNNISDTTQARQAALNQIDAALRRGVDVPITVGWDGTQGGAHALLVTDVRGNGNDRRYLMNDPGTGRTEWISGQDIIDGHTDFMGATGRLISVFE